MTREITEILRGGDWIGDRKYIENAAADLGVSDPVRVMVFA